jgi:sulfite oxidase
LYGKRDDLIVYEDEPFNAESSRAALDAQITATDAFYVRGHGPVPDLDPDTFRLRVEGLVERPLELSLSDLHSGLLEHYEEVATLQCAGNRRAGLVAVRDIPGEAPWGPGATGTASWRGVRLADVLAIARPTAQAAHVGMEGADLCPEVKTGPERFGGSIPLNKALRPEVLLAYEMNGAPLEPVHGAPLRTVVPGYIGARSVKWLDRIVVQADPWDGYFQSVVYRMLPPDGAPAYGEGFPLGIVALNSDVLVPADGARVAAGDIEIRGYAFAGGERHVARVDVSTDGAGSWSQAELLADQGRWAWRQWRTSVRLDAGTHTIHVRAWDSSAATQPEDPAGLWNPKGYCNNAQARITVHVV